MELIQLVYHSKPSADIAGAARLSAFRNIHAASIRNNQRSAIGGFLMLTKTHFVQLLEGDRAAVMATYDRIKDDRRHFEATMIDMIACRTRSFGDWAMGAIHDELTITEAMLNCGIPAAADITLLTGRQVAALLGRLAERSASLSPRTTAA